MNCPEKRLLSVYADGELDSPWKEKVDAHVAVCPACARVCHGYAALSGKLAHLDTEREKAILARMKLMRPEQADEPSEYAARTRIRESRSVPFWKRPLLVPFPVVTVAAVALCLATALILTGRISSGNHDTGTSTIARTVISAQPATFQALVQSIDSQGGDSAMTIILPAETSLQGSGDPVLITASTVSGGNR